MRERTWDDGCTSRRAFASAVMPNVITDSYRSYSSFQSVFWKNVFGRPADSLEVYDDSEYLMSDKDLLVNRFVSVPKDLGDLNCGAFAAGMVRGILRSAGFPARVSACYSGSGPSDPPGQKTTNILIN